MDVFTILYFGGILIEMAIRAPLNRRRRQQRQTDERVSTLERVLLGLLFLAMFLVPVIYAATQWLGFADYSLPAWAGWLGVALLAGALLVFWRAHADLGLNWSPSLQIREQHELVTRGIYGVIRHPMYASQFLWVLAQPLLLHNWVAGWLDLLVFVPFYFLRVGPEERMMLDTFGDRYREYMQRVGGVIPKLNR
jgi:protein-S-isoprenylcysteine O-methyltransferase Ste14